jgi:hypothetical protein
LLLLCRSAPQKAGVDAILHDIARPEYQHTPGRDWNLLARLGIAADPLTLLPNAKRTEGGKFDRFPCRQANRDLLQDEFHEFLRLVTG